MDLELSELQRDFSGRLPYMTGLGNGQLGSIHLSELPILCGQDGIRNLFFI